MKLLRVFLLASFAAAATSLVAAVGEEQVVKEVADAIQNQIAAEQPNIQLVVDVIEANDEEGESNEEGEEQVDLEGGSRKKNKKRKRRRRRFVTRTLTFTAVDPVTVTTFASSTATVTVSTSTLAATVTTTTAA